MNKELRNKYIDDRENLTNNEICTLRNYFIKYARLLFDELAHPKTLILDLSREETSVKGLRNQLEILNNFCIDPL